MDVKKVFEALPHVNTIWVVGENFHLHPNYGGEQINREDQDREDIKKVERPKKVVEPEPEKEPEIKEETKCEMT
jgi:hypothetical protein